MDVDDIGKEQMNEADLVEETFPDIFKIEPCYLLQVLAQIIEVHWFALLLQQYANGLFGEWVLNLVIDTPGG